MSVKPGRTQQDPLLNRLQPQNIEAEESLLSALLLHNDTLLDVVEILTPKAFYKSAHEKIYAAITELFSRDEPVDLVTVANRLKEKAQLEEIGGATYLARLTNTIPVAQNALHYAKIIRDKGALRDLIAKSTNIINRCFDDAGDVDEIIDYAENVIFELAEEKVKAAFSHTSELVHKNIDTLEERQGRDGELTGIATGYGQLDKITAGLQNSDLIILAARPAMGKTSFALNLARNVAVDEGIPVAVFSLEMSKEQLSMRLLTSESRVPNDRLKGGYLSGEDWSRITDAASVIGEAPIYIDDDSNLTSMDIRAKTRRLKMDKGLGLIVIDYLQLMKSPNSMGERRDLEIAEISRSLKGLAKELDVPIIALSQLNRMLEQRAEKRPLMSDLRESGSLEQDADIVAFIYRDEVYNKEENNPLKGKAELIISKNRHGATGTVHMSFIGQFTRFENLATGDYSDY